MGQFFFFQHPLQDKEAPDFILKTTLGRTVKMSEYLNDKNGIIFFWATWCPHCRTQLKELNKKKQEFEAQDIKVVLVDLQEGSVDSTCALDLILHEPVRS